jgi:hypothetical protein
MKELKLLIVALIVLIGAIFSFNKAFGMTFKQAQSIYYQVAHKNLFTVPPFKYDPTSDIDAYWTGYYVVVTQGLLDSVRNNNEMAVILGHELGHYQQAHWSDSKTNELLADRLGFTFAVKAGYSGCKGMRWILRNGYENSDHPSGRDRYNRLCGGKR